MAASLSWSNYEQLRPLIEERYPDGHRENNH